MPRDAATTTAERSGSRCSALSGRLATFGAVLLCAVALVIVSQGRQPLAPRLASLVLLLFEQGVVVLAYLAAAMGWGDAVVRLVREPALKAVGLAGRLIVGVAVMALAMWLLGWAGQLHAVSAWGLGTLGWALLGWRLYQVRQQWWGASSEQWPTLPWPVLLAVPAGTLMLGAACIPPGILWASEHQGYDVLSYHLQLPKEWIAGGAITGLTHNVYSFMPNLFETAFAQLGLWRGSMVHASYTAQLLHGAMAILTAVVVGKLVFQELAKAKTRDRTLAPAVVGGLAGALYLAVPWTVVTGSLAYNEQAMAALATLALAVALALDAEQGERTMLGAVRGGAVVGTLVGLAVLTKLTAIGMAALPVGVLMAMNLRGGRAGWFARMGGLGVAAGAVVGLWMLRNYLWTGNPVFPMLTGLFGTAHWSAEQAERWDAAHLGGGIFEGLFALGPMALWHGQFAWIVWPMTIAAGVLGWRHAPLKRTTKLLVIVLAVQMGFWLLMTHHQSRFLLPMLPPACVLIGLSAPAWRSKKVAASALAGVVVVCTAVSFGIYLAEHQGAAPVYIDRLEQLRRYQPQLAPPTPANQINRHVPPDGRVYAEALANPFYIDRPITYHTVWDASPIGELLAEDRFAALHQRLLDEGYTHVVVAWQMLELWQGEDNYGYDPNVSRSQLAAFAEQALRPVERAGPVMIYSIRPR